MEDQRFSDFLSKLKSFCYIDKDITVIGKFSNGVIRFRSGFIQKFNFNMTEEERYTQMTKNILEFIDYYYKEYFPENDIVTATIYLDDYGWVKYYFGL